MTPPPAPRHKALAHTIPLSLLWFSVASGHVVQESNLGLRAYSQGPIPQRASWRARGLSSGRPRAPDRGGKRGMGGGKHEEAAG